LDYLALVFGGNLSKYDMDLILWKKANKLDPDDGYALIPDSILIPYAIKDVIAVMRAYPVLLRRLESQGLMEFYTNLVNPFVTDCFSSFVIGGLPVDVEAMNELRDLYSFVLENLTVRFKEKVHYESLVLFIKQLTSLDNGKEFVLEFLQLFGTKRFDDMFNRLKEVVGVSKISLIKPHFDHLVVCYTVGFNPGSSQHKSRWLFGVKGLQPVKSTAQKSKGLPAMDWSKVMELPVTQQSLYTPAVDSQTLQILSQEDDMLVDLLRLNSVKSIANGFLKPGTYVENEYGEEELIRENGLMYWVQADGYIHCNYSLTQTFRSRSWRPNILNLTSYGHQGVASAMEELFTDMLVEGVLPERFEKYTNTEVRKAKKLPSLRYCIRAPSGWAIVEADFICAELISLGFESGDKNLLKILLEPDAQFVVIDDPEKDNPVVRVGFSDNCGIAKEQQDSKFLYAYWEEGKLIKQYSEKNVKRDNSLNPICPRSDLHWGAAELVKGMPRELLNKKIHRNGIGKVVNFKTSYKASTRSLERGIYADTGKKVEEGLGERIYEVLDVRQPQAMEYLRSLEKIPEVEGQYRASSGAIRHFHLHPDNSKDVSWKVRKSILSNLGREMRNFPLQHSVGATAIRAGIGLLAFKNKFKLEGYLGVILYDSCVTFCPKYERIIWEKAQYLYMTLSNGWWTTGGLLRYEIDADRLIRWSWPDKKDPEVKQLYDDSFEPTPHRLKHVELWLDIQIKFYKDNPLKSVYNVKDIPEEMLKT
jgi:hypothetical protein